MGFREEQERERATLWFLAQTEVAANNTNGTEPDRNLIDALLVRPLRYLADKAGSAVIGSLAAKILEWLLNL